MFSKEAHFGGKVRCKNCLAGLGWLSDAKFKVQLKEA
jgi:hypothetical protein